jgi:flavin-dependent dehydrogenase
MTAREQFDVAILGGGPAGCAAAIMLAREGISVGLFERSSYETSRIGEVVPPAICQSLRTLGAWDEFVARRPLPLTGITSRWGTSRPNETDYIFNPYGSGWILERKRFDAMLARVAVRNGANLFCQSRVKTCRQDTAGHWQIGLQTNGEIWMVTAQFVIRATGRISAVRGLESRRIIGDRLIAAVRHASAECSEAWDDQRLHIETSKDGWWYATRLPGHHLVVAHLTDADCFPGQPEQRKQIWNQRFRSTKTSNCHAPLSFADLNCFPAGASCAEIVAGPGWAAIGDAAFSIDPLSGQGIMRALESGIEVASLILVPGSQQADLIADYRQHVARRFQESVRKANTYYRLEKRWPQSSFWSRRRGNLTEPSTQDVDA